MSIYRNLPRYEFGAMRGGGCDVSFFQAAGNMGVMTRQLVRVLFCIAYKVMHQPFFGINPRPSNVKNLALTRVKFLHARI